MIMNFNVLSTSSIQSSVYKGDNSVASFSKWHGIFFIASYYLQLKCSDFGNLFWTWAHIESRLCESTVCSENKLKTKDCHEKIEP